MRLALSAILLIVTVPLHAISGEIHEAAKSGDIEQLTALLAANPGSIGETDESGRTPLHLAAWSGQVYAVTLLLEKGADASALDAWAQTPLHVAANAAIAEALLKAGSPIDAMSVRSVTPLHSSMEFGRLDVAQLLLDAGALVDATDFEDKTPLHYAAFFDHPEIANLLLARGAKVNARMTDAETPLIVTARTGALEVARMLIAHGAEIDARDKNGATALHAAAAEGQVSIVKVLLEHGAEVDGREMDPDGLHLTPLIRATDYGHPEIVQLLIEHGADLAADNNLYKSTALHFAAQSDLAPEERMQAVMRTLIARGAVVNAPNGQGDTPLHRAAFTGHGERAELLLSAGADINAQSAAGLTPLHAASSVGNVDVASRLLSHGALVNTRSKDGATALIGAVTQGSIDLARLLLTAGADSKAWMINGKTPLSIAVALENEVMSALLLSFGADINGANPLNGETPAIEAAGRGQADMIRWLVAKGADVRIRRQDGETALHAAARGGHLAAIDALLGEGLHVNEPDNRGETPLHEAAAAGQLEAVTMLIERTAPIERTAVIRVVDQEGNSPLHWAAAGGYTAVAQALIDAGAFRGDRNDLGLTSFDLAARRKNAGTAELLALLAVPDTAGKSASAVGDLADPDKLKFSGNNTFSADALRYGLLADLDFLIASHPVAPLESYLRTIETRLLAGYLASGFPNAKITAGVAGDRRQILVEVSEGPRFIKRKVRIEGARSIPADVLAQRLTGMKLGLKPDIDFSKPLAAAAWTKADEDAIWRPGEPASFDASSLETLKSAITAKLWEFGYAQPKLDLVVDVDMQEGTADLVVLVLDEGMKVPVDQIDVSGNLRNSLESIHRYLNIKPEDADDPDALRSIESKLIQSGRFMSASANIEWTGLAGEAPKRKLAIGVVESPFGPTLDQSLSPNEVAALRLCDWIARATGRGDGYVFQLLDQSGLQFARIVASTAGITLVVEDPEAPTAKRVQFAGVVTKKGVRLYDNSSAVNVSLPPPPAVLNAYVTLLADDLAFGSGYRVGYASRRPALDIQLTVTESACLRLAEDMKPGDDTADRVSAQLGVMTVSFEPATGRLIDAYAPVASSAEELRGLWPDLADRLAAIHISVEPNALEHSAEQISTSIPAAPTEQAMQSLMSVLGRALVDALVAREPVGSIVFPAVQADTRTLAAQALQKLLFGAEMQSIEALSMWPATAGDSMGTFEIPSPEFASAATAEDNLFANLAAGMHGTARRLAQADSWPAKITRIMALLRGGRALYVGAEIDDVLAQENIGPIGYLISAAGIRKLGSPAYQAFARRGLEVLTADGFQQDMHLLLDEDRPLGQLAAGICRKLGAMSKEEVQALAALLPDAARQPLQDGVLALRAHDSRPLEERLQPALDRSWQQWISPWVQSRLDRLAWAEGN